MSGAGQYTNVVFLEKGSIDRQSRDSRVKDYQLEHKLYCRVKKKDYDRALDAQGVKFFRVFEFYTPFRQEIADLSPRMRRLRYKEQEVTLHSITDKTDAREELVIKGYQEL